MATDNLSWGAERIHGELLKLGIQAGKRTIQRVMGRKDTPSPSGQSQATLLKNHAPHIWACDFTQVYDIFFRSLFIFIIIEHASRRIVHVAVTHWESQRCIWTITFKCDPVKALASAYLCRLQRNGRRQERPWLFLCRAGYTMTPATPPER